MVCNTIISVQGVSKSFGGIRALNSVDFDFNKGDCVGIVGPNGSGKTTLVNVITGFIRCDEGRVLFKGKNITNLPPHKIADKGIARTFQITRPFNSLPAYKNLVIPLYSPRVRRTAGGAAGDRDAVALDILEEIGFERDARVPYKPAAVLPIGYLKRLELGRCLALRPEVIICDEIFSGLSMAEIATLVPIVEKLNMEGVGIIMIEHRLRELFRIVNKVLVLNYGNKLAEGVPEEVMARPEVMEAYIGAA